MSQTSIEIHVRTINQADGADKQLSIEQKLKEIDITWNDQNIEVAQYKSRGELVLNTGVANEIIEKLEDSQSQLAQVTSNVIVMNDGVQ
jgi:hypothetical protein